MIDTAILGTLASIAAVYFGSVGDTSAAWASLAVAAFFLTHALAERRR